MLRSGSRDAAIKRPPVSTADGEGTMAKDHGPSIKDDKQYEGLRKKGMSKERAAKIANSPGAEKRGGKAAAKKSSGKKSSRKRASTKKK
jgi:hypothetical protein